MRRPDREADATWRRAAGPDWTRRPLKRAEPALNPVACGCMQRMRALEHAQQLLRYGTVVAGALSLGDKLLLSTNADFAFADTPLGIGKLIEQ